MTIAYYVSTHVRVIQGLIHTKYQYQIQILLRICCIIILEILVFMLRAGKNSYTTIAKYFFSVGWLTKVHSNVAHKKSDAH